MNISRFSPSEILKPYIRYYWIYQAKEARSIDTLLPRAHVELAINITEGKEVVAVINNKKILTPATEVFGQITVPISVEASKGTAILLTSFYPHTASLFFPCSMSEFRNGSHDLQDIFSQEIDALYEKMMLADSIRNKISTLELFLMRRLEKNVKDLEKFRLINKICVNTNLQSGLSKLEDLITSHSFSHRYIQKLFREFVGLSPKQFFQVQRLKQSLPLVEKYQDSLTQTALTCGYYDQAHFIKEFKQFLGMTPSEYRNTKRIAIHQKS
jgi:AraC-like DNA-binding protein